jgi:hypothetical protein
MAEIHSAKPDRIADCAVVTSQLGPGWHVSSGDVVAKGNTEGLRVWRLAVIEVPAVVAAQHPQFQTLMQCRIGVHETLQPIRHAVQLRIRENPVDAAVETPDQLTNAHGFSQKHADAVNCTDPKLRLDHHHHATPDQRGQQRSLDDKGAGYTKR